MKKPSFAVSAGTAAIAALSLLATPGALAQAAFPSKNLVMIVPYTAAGSADAMSRAIAQRLIRRLEDEAAAQPGARLVATCSPYLAATVEGLVRELGERFGHRFTVSLDANRPRDQIDVRSA